MIDVIVPPDAEALMVRYLADTLGESVSTRVPNPRPDRFLRLERVGGSRRNRVTDEAIVVVEAWALTELEASDLARRAYAHTWALEQTDTPEGYVRRVRDVAGPQNYPDPTSEKPRYVFTVLLDLRGAPL